MSEDGFAAFFRCRSGKTVVLLIATGASRADAEDATQEAMILAWHEWNSIREPAAWVRKVAYRRYLRIRSLPDNNATSLDASTYDLADHDDLHIFTEEQQYVLRLFRKLPPGQRTIAALFYDGMACDEIADVLEKPPATIRSQLRHARETLKEMMASGEA